MNPTDHSITTRNEFEYKLLMRLRQLDGSGARVLVDLDAQELQVLNRIESLRAKHMSSTRPIAAIVFES